jgi:hypothetical protein
MITNQFDSSSIKNDEIHHPQKKEPKEPETSKSAVVQGVANAAIGRYASRKGDRKRLENKISTLDADTKQEEAKTFKEEAKTFKEEAKTFKEETETFQKETETFQKETEVSEEKSETHENEKKAVEEIGVLNQGVPLIFNTNAFNIGSIDATGMGVSGKQITGIINTGLINFEGMKLSGNPIDINQVRQIVRSNVQAVKKGEIGQGLTAKELLGIVTSKQSAKENLHSLLAKYPIYVVTLGENDSIIKQPEVFDLKAPGFLNEPGDNCRRVLVRQNEKGELVPITEKEHKQIADYFVYSSELEILHELVIALTNSEQGGIKAKDPDKDQKAGEVAPVSTRLQSRRTQKASHQEIQNKPEFEKKFSKIVEHFIHEMLKNKRKLAQERKKEEKEEIQKEDVKYQNKQNDIKNDFIKHTNELLANLSADLKGTMVNKEQFLISVTETVVKALPPDATNEDRVEIRNTFTDLISRVHGVK